MPADLDPYRDWLGIAEPERPVSYYQLLGVERSETGDAVISAAADDRIAKVRKQLKGPNARLARRTLFELEAAKSCLLDPAARGSYDESLKSGAISRAAIKVGKPHSSTPASDAPPPELRSALSDLLDEALPTAPAPEVPRDLSALQLAVTRKPRNSKSREALTVVLVIVVPAIALIGLGALAVSFIESRLAGSGDAAPPVATANQVAEPPDHLIQRQMLRQTPVPGPSSSSLSAAPPSGVNAIGLSTNGSGRAQKNLTPSTNAADAESAPHRLAAPSADALAEAGRRVREGVAKQIEQADTPERKSKFAQSLMDSPPTPGKAPSDRFAQLDLARGLALDAQDARLFGQIVDQLAVEFEVDGMALKIAGLSALFARELPPEPRLNLVKTSVMFINRLADAERFDEAVKLAKSSFAAARELGEERIVTYLTVRGKELVASQARFVAAKAALAVLRERPTDPTANE
jgi:hypothetical protein